MTEPSISRARGVEQTRPQGRPGASQTHAGEVTRLPAGEAFESSITLLEALYARLYDQLVRTAALMTAAPSVAEDLVQDAFVGVAHRIDKVANPDAYLHTAVVNRCSTWLRRRALEQRLLARSRQLAETSEPSLLVFVLEALPWKQRVAITLRYFDDYDDRRIANVLGCRPSTVRSLVHRGLVEIRRLLRQSESLEE